MSRYSKYSARIALIFVLASGLVSSDVEPSSIGLILHQPHNFPQMQALVTPSDPAVTRVLDPVLGGITDASGQKDHAARFDRLRDWVLESVTYAFDVNVQHVNDYWQSPSQTLALRTGDCEDFAILLVSLLRASGVPDDQVYVAVGYDAKGECHALLIERYCTGLWRFVTADSADEPTFVDPANGLAYDISYCFNDLSAFTGLPQYPSDYTTPPMPTSTAPEKTRYDHVRLKGIPPTGWFEGEMYLRNPGYDAIKNRMGRLWLPAYLPQGYFKASSGVSGNWSSYLTYRKEGSSASLSLNETAAASADYQFPENTVEELLIHDQPAYLVRGIWSGSAPNYQSVWNADLQLSLYFRLDGLLVTITGYKAADWTSEDLIKIAESMTPY